MHFSKIYIQENFVPNIVQDQYGRKVIGTEVTLDINDKVENAIALAEQFIAEYIQKNTVIPDHNHIQEKYIPEEQLPSIQVERETELREMTLEEQIRSCTDIKVLQSYKFIAKNDMALGVAYNERMEQLKSKLAIA